MAEPRRLTELRSGIEGRARFPDPPHVVGLSGGADSAALALLASSSTGDRPLRCLHVHHGLPGSDKLAAAAHAIAEQLSADLEIAHVQVGEGPSPEAMAREVRYRTFAENVPSHMALLLGHTRNDQAETLLLNLIRGAGANGLAGMPYHRPPNIYRPLLEVTRAETRELATLAGLPFVDDPTNADPSLRRNRLRLEVIPRLEEMNPGLVDSLARTASHLRGDADYLRGVAEASSDVEVGEGWSAVPVGALIVVDRPIRARILDRFVESVRPDGGLTAAELERVESVLFGQSAATELEGGYRVARDKARIVVSATGGAHW